MSIPRPAASLAVMNAPVVSATTPSPSTATDFMVHPPRVVDDHRCSPTGQDYRAAVHPDLNRISSRCPKRTRPPRGGLVVINDLSVLEAGLAAVDRVLQQERARGGRRPGVSSWPSGMMSRALAAGIEVRIPDPCGPVSRASGRRALRRRPHGGNAGAGASAATASATRTGTVRRNGRRCPAIFRIAGRTNSSNVTMVLTGLPGRPIHGTPAASRSPTGAPGRIRIFQKRCSAPMASEHAPQIVVLADADAGRGHQQVGVERARQVLSQALGGVARDPEIDRLRPRPPHQRHAACGCCCSPSSCR